MRDGLRFLLFLLASASVLAAATAGRESGDQEARKAPAATEHPAAQAPPAEKPVAPSTDSGDKDTPGSAVDWPSIGDVTKVLSESIWGVEMLVEGKSALQVLEEELFPPEQTITLPLVKGIVLTTFLLAKEITYESWAHDKEVRLTGPFLDPQPNIESSPYFDGAGYGVHARVKIYYSDGVVNWLKGGRQGDIADGEMIIKEMYPADPSVSPDQPGGALTGYAVMIRQKAASVDGWLWYVWFVQPPIPGVGQYGMSFCLSCHDSADNDQLTFVDIGNIDPASYSGSNPDDYRPTSGTWIVPPAYQPPLKANRLGHASSQHALITSAFAQSKNDGAGQSTAVDYDPAFPHLPSDLLFNHVVARADSSSKESDALPKNVSPFVTSDACVGCHDASYLQNNRLPNMMYAVRPTKETPVHAGESGPRPTYYNLSMWSEWNGSLMSQSSRDPVFLAQLEYERFVHNPIQDYISNFCVSCHGAMGQRQFHAANPDGYFTPDLLTATPNAWTGEPNEPQATYGALARDGVSCSVCHRIKPDNLGEEASFNARFVLGPADEIYGPYAKEGTAEAKANPIRTKPMQKGLGLTPKYGETIGQSKLCGSCHTVMPPKVPKDFSPGPDSRKEIDELPKSHEQTTYLEWRNSQYSDEKGKTKTSQTCADCHMPSTFEGTNLSFQIANIEDSTFPIMPTRGSATDIDLSPRTPYRRHVLTGINLFTMTIMRLFSNELGRLAVDPYTTTLGTGKLAPVDRLVLAEKEALQLAQKRTIELSVSAPATEDDGELSFDVTVKNLAGHSFPSGVGFRRAWVSVKVSYADGKSWTSGASNSEGQIVDGDGTPLPCETDYTQTSKLQPDYDTITSQDQAQIYEERETDENKQLTISFLSLFNTYKNNRLLPLGWSADGPDAQVTAPVAGGDPAPIPETPGIDKIAYKVTSPTNADWTRVEVEVFYQALPPYYLDHFANKSDPGSAPNAMRLTKLVAAVKGTDEYPSGPIAGWRLSVGREVMANESPSVGSRPPSHSR